MDFETNKGIYKITCLVTGKFYIGSSVDLKRRKFWHFCQLRHNKHKNVHLQKAFNKYGADNFVFSVVEFLPTAINKYDIISIEQRYIDNLKACDHKIGYNICRVAGQPGERTGFKHSKKTIKLFSEQRKDKKKSEGFKQILSKMYKGKSMKERTKNPEWSNNKKGKSMKEITGDENWTDPKIGRKHTPEAIQKMSKSKQGKRNPAYGKPRKKNEERILAQTGCNNHMFGKTGDAHYGFKSELITLVNKQEEILSQTRFYWRSIKVDINAILNGDQISSRGWRLPN